MVSETKNCLTKEEISSQSGIQLENISLWADQFSDWLDTESRYIRKLHDVEDIKMFYLIAEIDRRIDQNITFPYRRILIENMLCNTQWAVNIREIRSRQKQLPEEIRWNIVGGNPLRRDFEWLSVLEKFVKKLIVFGCWASDELTTCAESYALTWILEADKVFVVDKNENYIRNGEIWLENTRSQYPFFNSYNLNFYVGDLLKWNLNLPSDYFDLAFCRDVLYYIGDIPNGLKVAIGEMKRVIRPEGWIIAIEEKIGVEYEIVTGGIIDNRIPKNDPKDISSIFLELGLNRYQIKNIPDYTYVFQKPLKSSAKA